MKRSSTVMILPLEMMTSGGARRAGALCGGGGCAMTRETAPQEPPQSALSRTLTVSCASLSDPRIYEDSRSLTTLHGGHNPP